MFDADHPNPCKHCGGTNFGLQYKCHSNGRGYELSIDRWPTPWRGIDTDWNFLRAQGIRPDLEDI